MKRFLILIVSTGFLVSSLTVSAQVKPAKNTETKAKVKTQNVKMKVKGNLSAVDLPYPVSYSSQFIPGDPVYNKTVLDLWKDFEMNTLDRHTASIADTFAVRLVDGTWYRGLEQVSEAVNAARSNLTKVERNIDAVVSLHSIDKDEDWVLLWGTSKETAKDGKMQSIPLHELWRINKDGKVDLLMQFTHGDGKQ